MLNLDGEEKYIPFSEVVSYEVEYYNGVTLRLKLADKSKFKVQALTAFCNAEAFEQFCKELERTLTRHTRARPGTLVRKPSFFEQKWVPGFLIMGTLVIVWIVIRNVSAGNGIRTALVPMGLFATL